MRLVSRSRWVALALELAALAVLGLALGGIAWLDPRSMSHVLVLVDRSLSMPRAAADSAVSKVIESAKRARRIDVRVIEFAGRTNDGSVAPENFAALEPGSTNIERALDAALSAHARTRYSDVVVVSDAHENSGDGARALRAAREARLPVHWVAVGRRPPETHIVDVLAPARAMAGQSVQLTVQLGGRFDRPLRVSARTHDASGATQSVTGAPDRLGRATFDLAASGEGAMLVDVFVEDASSGARLDARPNAVAFDVTGRAPVLYVEGAPGVLSRSLIGGGWTLDVVAATRLDAYAGRLGGYKAVVLDDVAISDAGSRFWSTLAAAVRDDGLGLMVLGGERAFTRGGYSKSTLESVLPVLSDPAALDEGASVVFLVDKSGSMAQGSAGVDRFRLAQRAVLETARGLSERDAIALVVFDVEARVLMPLTPAREALDVLARDWPVSSRGGTKLGPAFDSAIRVLEQSATGRRTLVLVTDGFVDEAPIAALPERLERSRIETIALAVGPDADATALERLIGTERRAVVRVSEAAELPRAMRATVERHRARVERGTIGVTQRESLPFTPRVFASWPAITAYAVTRSRRDALVPVHSERGDPLIAFQNSGQGRVAAVTSGFGRWTPQWIRWGEWPRLAGALTAWVSGAADDQGTLALRARDTPGAIQVEADARSQSGWSPDIVTIAVRTPAADTRVMKTNVVAPGRSRVTVPDAGPGLYQFNVSTSRGTQRLLHVRRERAEMEAWGTNPALDEWESAGLIRAWSPATFSELRDSERAGEPDRWLIAAGLALFLAGIAVDRSAGLRRRRSA